MPSSFQRITPATPTFRSDGTLFSPQFDDIYASSEGTLAQARHVFLAGNGLPERWRTAERFTIVETGFGAGLNFLAAWQARREVAPGHAHLHFVSVEKHPFLRADLERIHSHFPELAKLAGELLAVYPLSLPGFHRLHLDGGRVTLTLLFGEAAEMLQQLDAAADAFFLDGFAPAKNPEMWNPAVFTELARLARPGATIATYTVAGQVRQGLAAAGFTVERREGFGTKRQMLVGRFAGEDVKVASTERRALVIGAGLAGTACAQRLAERGWSVDVIERHAAPAQEASGNPAGLVRPVFSQDWNSHSRFTTAGFLYSLRHHSALARAGRPITCGEGGVLQLARDSAQFEKQRRITEQFGLPVELAQLVDETQAAELAGTKVAAPGWWFPHAAWVDPASICTANLAASGQRVRARFGLQVAGIERRGEQWEVIDASGQLIAAAPVLVLANAHLARQFAPAAELPLRAVRGQISLLPERAGRHLRIAVCREGYFTPAIGGRHCLGASYNEGLFDETLRVEDHIANLHRLEKMLPGFGEGLEPVALAGRVAFRAMTSDRLPILGQMPSQPGLYACLGLGSRGMTWSALAAEIVASRIAGDPMPVERDLLAALDPGRFEKKRETKSRTEVKGLRAD